MHKFDVISRPDSRGPPIMPRNAIGTPLETAESPVSFDRWLSMGKFRNREILHREQWPDMDVELY